MGGAAAALAGLALLVAGPVDRPAGAPPGLGPWSVIRALAALPPAGARDVRVANLYGSAHRGSWQFVAFLTWRRPGGGLAGGRTVLPLLAGEPMLTAGISGRQLAVQQRIGWSLPALRRVLDRLPVRSGRLAMLEAATLPGRPRVVTECRQDAVAARCEQLSAAGRVLRRFADRLLDAPFEGPIAVQRVDAPIGAAGP